jgi:1,2-diacylglycerol 3-beta-galactosyltransferase
MGLPIMVTKNALTLPQERYNADWVKEQRVGIVLQHFGEVVKGLDEMLDAERLRQFQANARRIKNRAVFEIPEMIAKLLG